MTDAERAVLALMRGGRVYVPHDVADETVAQIEAQGCEVVRCAWCTVIVWMA